MEVNQAYIPKKQPFFKSKKFRLGLVVFVIVAIIAALVIATIIASAPKEEELPDYTTSNFYSTTSNEEPYKISEVERPEEEQEQFGKYYVKADIYSAQYIDEAVAKLKEQYSNISELEINFIGCTMDYETNYHEIKTENRDNYKIVIFTTTNDDGTATYRKLYDLVTDTLVANPQPLLTTFNTPGVDPSLLNYINSL